MEDALIVEREVANAPVNANQMRGGTRRGVGDKKTVQVREIETGFFFYSLIYTLQNQ